MPFESRMQTFRLEENYGRLHRVLVRTVRYSTGCTVRLLALLLVRTLRQESCPTRYDEFGTYVCTKYEVCNCINFYDSHVRTGTGTYSYGECSGPRLTSVHLRVSRAGTILLPVITYRLRTFVVNDTYRNSLNIEWRTEPSSHR